MGGRWRSSAGLFEQLHDPGMGLFLGQGPGVALLKVQRPGIGAGVQQQGHHRFVAGLGGVHQGRASQLGGGLFECGAMGNQQLGTGQVALARGPGQRAVAQGLAWLLHIRVALQQQCHGGRVAGDSGGQQGRAPGALVLPFKVRASIKEALDGREIAACGGFFQ